MCSPARPGPWGGRPPIGGPPGPSKPGLLAQGGAPEGGGGPKLPGGGTGVLIRGLGPEVAQGGGAEDGGGPRGVSPLGLISCCNLRLIISQSEQAKWYSGIKKSETCQLNIST